MWWVWVVIGLVAWMVIAGLLAVVIGRSVRLADSRSPGSRLDGVLTTADLPAPLQAPRPAAVVRTRRRPIPIPNIGVALLAVAVLAETVGYAVRLSGARGAWAHLLSMDAVLSLPRMFVAALFAAGAFAAVAGAGRLPGRRVWWLGVGAVGAAVATVKAGSTVHADALKALTGAVGAGGALLISAVTAVAVVGTLWFLSRHERRDRRRVLSALALYAGSSVGLSAISSAVAGAVGGASTWAATATFLEESGEALSAVGFLIAVLAGVAPRLVLPAAWTLRRSADAHTLDVAKLPVGPHLDGPPGTR